MANLRINLRAETTGDHYIGWRCWDFPTPGDPTDFHVETVNVTGTVPQDIFIDIHIRSNLYCAYDGVEYKGYIIAACQPQTDDDADGIPDAATQWTVLVPQLTDPCILTNILCEAVGIDTVVLNNGPLGSGASDGNYTAIVTETNPGDEILPATVTFAVQDHDIVGFNVDVPGLYKAPPTITLPPAVLPVSPDPDITITMLDCPEITLDTYVCAGNHELSGDTGYEFALGNDIDICTDVTKLSLLPVGYLATPGENCHCQGCENVIVGTSAGGGLKGKVSYQACWDGSGSYGPLMLITREVSGAMSPVNLGCIILDTLVIDNGNLPIGSEIQILSHGPCPS